MGVKIKINGRENGGRRTETNQWILNSL